MRKPRAHIVMSLVLCAQLLTLVGPAAASERPDEDGTDGDGAVAQVDDFRLASPYQSQGQAFWIWEERDMGFFPVSRNSSTYGPDQVVGRDLATGEELVDMRFPSGTVLYEGAEIRARELGPDGVAQPHVAAVDPVGGRIFFTYQRYGLADHGQFRRNPAEPPVVTRDGGTCTYLGKHPVSGAHCAQGVYAFDMRTGALVSRMPFRVVNPNGGALGGQLLALHWAPPRAEGDEGKLLALLSESTHQVYNVVNDGVTPRVLTATTTFLVQLDPDTGAQEWAVRLDACRGGRETRDSLTNSRTLGMPWPATILRQKSMGEPAILVGCHTSFSTQQAAVVTVPLDAAGNPASLPVAVADPGRTMEAVQAEAPEPPVYATQGQAAVFGPDKVYQMLAEPGSERLFFQVLDGSPLAEVWWVYDPAVGRFTGTIGIGAARSFGYSMAGIDPHRGRLYVLTPKGLFLIDVRRTPIPQALVYPGLGALFDPRMGDGENARRAIMVRSAAIDGVARLYVAEKLPVGSPYRLIEDRLAAAADPVSDAFAGRSLDLEERPGVTHVALDGTARGYGARILMVGGLEAAGRVGPADPVGAIEDCNASRERTGLNQAMPCHQARESFGGVVPVVSTPCTAGNRDVALAFAGPEGPAVVDASGSRGGAKPVVVDTATRADSEAPASRCGTQDWQGLWTSALFGAPAVAEPSVPWVFSDGLAQCVSGQGTPTDNVGDPITGKFSAGVACEQEEASGYAYVRSVTVDGLSLGEVLSSFRVYRDVDRGVVSRVESVVRGFALDGVLRIDTVRGVAESWANGRRQPTAVIDRPAGYNANCDFERTAGTCFKAHVLGVWTPGYTCGPCGDEATVADRLTRALGANGAVRFRQPDPTLAKGAENGFIAAVSKPNTERFADLVLNNDMLQTMLPTMEIIRYTPPNRPVTRGGPRGRQIIQLAGVEVSSSYGIACLLVYDEATNTCAEPAEAPGSIQVSLSDTDGKPLAGGAFEVRADVDADGVLGLKDTLLPDGACVTAEDGVGTCMFENLKPGTYLVSQVAAPPGYAKSSEPWVSEVASGEQRTVAFTNVSNVSTIDLTATDENGEPISGAVFAAYPDPDGDGKVAPEAQPAATCTTSADGTCAMRVPAGSYVLVQTAAPGGLEGIEPVPFTFASGGQVAAVTITNHPPVAGGVNAPPSAPSPVYSPPVDMARPVESIDDGYAPPAAGPEIAPDDGGMIGQVGGTMVQVIRAPGDALRLLSRDPKQAVAWIAALALFCLAAMAVRRRQAAMALMRS